MLPSTCNIVLSSSRKKVISLGRPSPAVQRALRSHVGTFSSWSDHIVTKPILHVGMVGSQRFLNISNLGVLDDSLRYKTFSRQKFCSSSASKQNRRDDSKTLQSQDTSTETQKDEDMKSNSTSFLTEARRNQIYAICEQAKSIPNIITISRIMCTPVLCYLIVTHDYVYAISGCLIAGMSDWLDGYIAKTYGGGTVLGTYLDPLADKILINSLASSLCYVDILPGWCMITWLGRDVMLIGMSYRAAAIAAEGKGHAVADPSRTPLKVNPSFISKVNTVLQFGTISLGMGLAVYPDFNVALYGIDTMSAMCAITCATTVWSGIGYMDMASMGASGNNKK